MADDKKPEAEAIIRPSAELQAIQEFNFANPPVNIKHLNAGVSLPPRYGRAELTLARVRQKQLAGEELTAEEKKWVAGSEKGNGGEIKGTPFMRAMLDKHYDLIFWGSPHAARMNAEILRNMSKNAQFNISVQGAGKKDHTITDDTEDVAREAPGGKTQ